jgi:hypothetical protein
MRFFSPSTFLAISLLALGGVGECFAADLAQENARPNLGVDQDAEFHQLIPSHHSAFAMAAHPFVTASEVLVTRHAERDNSSSMATTAAPTHSSDTQFVGDFDAMAKVESPSKAVDDMQRNFHRDGLPIARLWQSNSTIFSIGLNNKGKPGLWLVKKIQ